MSRHTSRGPIQNLENIEKNLNSEYLVKNNLRVSLHRYSAQSFKKLNFSQRVPFKNRSSFRRRGSLILALRTASRA